MSAMIRTLLVVILLLGLMALGVNADTSPTDTTYTSISVGCEQPLDPPVAGRMIVPITAEGVAGDGVVGFQLNLNYDHIELTFQDISPGSDMVAMGCSFNTSKIATVGSDDLISGTCTGSIPKPGATGDVELALVEFSVPSAPYQVSLSLNPTGSYATGLIGPNANTPPTGGIIYPAQASQLLACTPTAVELSDMNANSAAPAALALWPLLAGGAAVAAGGAAFALRRQR